MGNKVENTENIEKFQSRRDIEAEIIAKAWKNEAYKQELLENSKAVMEAEFGREFRPEVTVEVLEESENSLHFVLPIPPQVEVEELSEEELEIVAGGGAGAVAGLVLGAAGLAADAYFIFGGGGGGGGGGQDSSSGGKQSSRGGKPKKPSVRQVARQKANDRARRNAGRG